MATLFRVGNNMIINLNIVHTIKYAEDAVVNDSGEPIPEIRLYFPSHSNVTTYTSMSGKLATTAWKALCDNAWDPTKE